jgi:hypothetical protein
MNFPMNFPVNVPREIKLPPAVFLSRIKAKAYRVADNSSGKVGSATPAIIRACSEAEVRACVFATRKLLKLRIN